MKNIILAAFAALALAAAPARAGSQPQRALDECYGKPLAVHVKGWAYDPDVSSQSIDVHVYLYTDSGCTSRYGDIRVLTANVPRPDVNQAKGITGDHGFDADIPVADAGDYWVKVFAIDATGDGNPQVGTTRSVTVAPGFPGSGTDADPYRISSVADWDVFAANVGAGFGSDSRYRLEADIGPVTNRVGASDHPFAGAFDGGGHTLAVAIDGAEAYAAPFSRIDGATIRDLVVTGTVAGGIHSAGLVGICGATGPNVIRDCTVAVTVNGSGYAGGIVGHGGSGTLALDGCVFGGSVNGFNTCAGGLMGWCDALTLTITNCLSKGSFTPSGDGKYHPVACRFANRDVSATVAGAYYLNTIVPTVPGVNPALARTNLIPGAEGTPVSATLVAGEWAEPVAAPDGNTYYAWTTAPAGRLLANYTFDDAGNAGLNLLRADVGADAAVRATQAVPVEGIGEIAAVTDPAILSYADGAVSIPPGQHLAFPIPAALLSAPGRPYTVVMRIRVPDDAGWRCLLNMPASNDSDAMVYVHRSDRKLAVKQFDKSDGAGVYSDTAVATDRWTTLAVAFGETATDAYCDGAPILHTAGALAGSYADCAAAGGYILVGADDGGDDALFYLSDFRVYEGACAPSAWTGRTPDNVLDACAGGEGAVHVAGWAYDPDVPSQSINVHVCLYTDPDCKNRYGKVRVLTTDVPRPDVNQAKGITGDHGFDADLPVAVSGTYWVKVFAIDATGDGNPQIGATTSVTIAPTTPVAVTVTKFHQSFPYSGRATVEYAVGGTIPSNAVAKIVIRTDDASATFVQSNIVSGAITNVIDFAPSFGGATLLTNASFEVMVTRGSDDGAGGVQLWENGPYWAECNVGAATPEEFGYYFWWGDTLGYRRENDAWVASDGPTPSFQFSGPTFGMNGATLLAEGYIDSTGNLSARHDAATAHLEAPWRMPTDAEFAALSNNCTAAWITTNGVSGRLVAGKGGFANRSIFLPAAGYGYSRETALYSSGSQGAYWSSTPMDTGSEGSWSRFFEKASVSRRGSWRVYGLSVRPVRGFDLSSADGIVTYDPQTQTTPVPVPYPWLDGYPSLLAGQSGDYEAAANATAANGRPVWACYVVGADPSDPFDDFRITAFRMDGDVPVFELSHTEDGGGRSILPYVRPLGKAELPDRWRHVPDGGNPAFRFFAVEVVPPGCEPSGGVQLWENGPYWAECNVGAATPEEYGYYFWWGDTVGYRRENDAWVAADGSSSDFRFTDKITSTYDKDDAELLSEGWIDTTGNLVASHDAATAHLGSPWRMPTRDEIDALISNCSTTWTTTNGVYGRLVTGRGEYANRSIFLPAAGTTYESDLGYVGWSGRYWSASSSSGLANTPRAWSFLFHSSYFGQDGIGGRYYGQPVRPVRDAD